MTRPRLAFGLAVLLASIACSDPASAQRRRILPQPGEEPAFPAIRRLPQAEDAPNRAADPDQEAERNPQRAEPAARPPRADWLDAAPALDWARVGEARSLPAPSTYGHGTLYAPAGRLTYNHAYQYAPAATERPLRTSTGAWTLRPRPPLRPASGRLRNRTRSGVVQPRSAVSPFARVGAAR